jgi:Ca2+-binding EF-hand superfamily protein
MNTILVLSRRFRRIAIIIVGVATALSARTNRADDRDVAPRRPGGSQSLDVDGNGAVSLDEFLANLQRSERPAGQWNFYERDFDADGWLSEEELVDDDPAKLSPHLIVFRGFDVDGNGSLSHEEYVAPARPKYEDAAKLEHALFDRDGDGALSFDEYCFSPRVDPGREARFRRLDIDRSGRLTLKEFLRPYSPAHQRTQRSVIYHWDADDDQQLSLEEYVQQGKGVTLSLRNKYLARDADDDGRLSREEYFTPFLGSQWEQAAQNEASQNDVDGDGFLTLLEFSFTPQERSFGETVFPLMDIDSDGFVSVAEFVKPRPREQRGAWGAVFHRSDQNADGQLGRDEFLQQGQEDRFRPDALVEVVRKLLREIDVVCDAADRDGNGRLTEREWPHEKIGNTATDLVGIPFREWDRDKDGGVTAGERQLLVEAAFGIRRTDGQPLRKPSGYVFDWNTFRHLDKDRDEILSRDEFISGFWEGAKNAERFQQLDKDGDGRLPFADLIQLGWFVLDVYGEFSRYDVDIDGRVTRDELMAHAAPWQKAMAQRLVATFDSDGSGSLGPDEFALTPFANPVADWYTNRSDTDNDGRLSPSEFVVERSPFLHGLVRRFFTRFDGDRDGFLSRAEFEFPIDFEKAPPQAALFALDRDGDGRLALPELAEPDRPQTNDPTVLLRWEEKTMRVEDAFRAADTNRDSLLTTDEFSNQQAALAAAVLGKPPPQAFARLTIAESASGPNGAGESPNWRFIGLVACNVLLLAGVAWMVLNRA